MPFLQLMQLASDWGIGQQAERLIESSVLTFFFGYWAVTVEPAWSCNCREHVRGAPDPDFEITDLTDQEGDGLQVGRGRGYRTFSKLPLRRLLNAEAGKSPNAFREKGKLFPIATRKSFLIVPLMCLSFLLKFLSICPSPLTLLPVTLSILALQSPPITVHSFWRRIVNIILRMGEKEHARIGAHLWAVLAFCVADLNSDSAVPFHKFTTDWFSSLNFNAKIIWT